MEYKDYYKILGVEKTATPDQIKHAYRRLARKYHPDVSKEADAENRFKDVQEAYEVLKDAEKRSAYDELGSNWKAGQDFRPPPGWGHQNTNFYSSNGGGFTEEDMGGFSDFFSNLFGRKRGSSFDDHGFEGYRQRGNDQRTKVTISLEEAFTGAAKTMHLQSPAIDANGQIREQTRTLKVNIPAGAKQGQQLRLAGQGGPGVGGEVAGDLYLEIDIQTHPLFTLQERDIYLTLPVTPWEAALGAEIKVPTLAGPVGLRLAAGSQAGQKLRLKGRGMPDKKLGNGDQYAVLQILIPSAQTDEQKQLYEKMAELMPFNPRQHWQA